MFWFWKFWFWKFWFWMFLARTSDPPEAVTIAKFSTASPQVSLLVLKILPKIDQKSSKNEAWEGPGGSWGWSWSHFGSLGAKRWQPLVRWPPFGRTKGSLWTPIFDTFRDLSAFLGDVFSKLCFEGVWAPFFIDFVWFSGYVLDVFLMCFWSVHH